MHLGPIKVFFSTLFLIRAGLVHLRADRHGARRPRKPQPAVRYGHDHSPLTEAAWLQVPSLLGAGLSLRCAVGDRIHGHDQPTLSRKGVRGSKCRVQLRAAVRLLIRMSQLQAPASARRSEASKRMDTGAHGSPNGRPSADRCHSSNAAARMGMGAPSVGSTHCPVQHGKGEGWYRCGAVTGPRGITMRGASRCAVHVTCHVQVQAMHSTTTGVE